MSLVFVAYAGSNPVIKTLIQPCQEEEDPCILELPSGSVAVTILNGENEPEPQGQQGPVPRIQEVATRSISTANENQSRQPSCLAVSCCYVVAMIPAAVLIAIAHGCAEDSAECKVFFWGGIVYIPLITARFLCACLRS